MARLKPAWIFLAVLMVVFLALGWAMADGLTDGFDHRLMLALRRPEDLAIPIGGKGIREAVRDITALGGTLLVVLLTVSAALLFGVLRQGRRAGILVAAVGLSWLASDLGKVLYDRPRPDIVSHVVYVASASFPSGHATHAAALYLTLAAMIAGLAKVRGVSLVAYGLAILIMIAVAFSRVYLGVHYPSDVLAGCVLGAACALIGWMTLKRLSRNP